MFDGDLSTLKGKARVCLSHVGVWGAGLASQQGGVGWALEATSNKWRSVVFASPHPAQFWYFLSKSRGLHRPTQEGHSFPVDSPVGGRSYWVGASAVPVQFLVPQTQSPFPGCFQLDLGADPMAI